MTEVNGRKRTESNPMFADFMDEENHEATGHEDDKTTPSSDHPLMDADDFITVGMPPALLLVYLSVFIDAFGGLMAIPVLPQVVLLAHAEGETFGLPVGLSFGLLSAGYQFFSVPSLICTTRLADVYGRRPFFVVGFFGSCFGFLVIAFHQSFTPMLVAVMLGRAVGGVFSSSPSLAHAYISDIAGIKSEKSSVYRSYLGSVFMFALIFAPGFGGGLSEFGLSTPFFVSAALAILGGTFAIIYLKESMPNPKPICSRKTTGMAMEDIAVSEMTTRERSTKGSKGNEQKDNSTVSAVELEAAAIKSEEEALVHHTTRLQGTILKLLFVCGALLNLGFRIFIMMGPLWIHKKFGWGAAMYGFCTSGVGCFGIFVNITLYPKILHKIGKHGTCVIGPLLACVGYMVIFSSRRTLSSDNPYAIKTILKGPIIYILGILIVVLGNATAQSSLTSLIARYASATAQAGIQGKYSAVQAVTGFCAPLLGGMIFDSPAWEATPAVSAALYFLFSVIARIIVALNHELHHIEQQRLKLMRSHATSEVDDDDDETESYPHHSWLQLIPGVKNPFTELHQHTYKLFHSSTGAQHPTAIAVQ